VHPTRVQCSLVLVTVLAALMVLPSASAWAGSPALGTVPPSVEATGDNAWLVPLVGGSALAVLLGAALLLVLWHGRRR
jgi:hypothetical protein